MNKNFSGGGILPIVDVKTKDGVVSCFITFSSYRGVISDAGGKVDINESIQKTCVREFFEESCMLFSINENNLKDNNLVDVTCGSTFYRVYLPKFSITINSSDFTKNYLEIKRQKKSKVYLEKNELVLIPITERTQSYLYNGRKYYSILDINGNVRKVSRRLHKIIKLFNYVSPVTEIINFDKVSKNGILTYTIL
jgi:hypothetical protein